MDNYDVITFQNLFNYDKLEDAQKVSIGTILRYTNPLGLTVYINREDGELRIGNEQGITDPLHYFYTNEHNGILTMLDLMCKLKGIDPNKSPTAFLEEEASHLRKENERLKAVIVKLGGGAGEQAQAKADTTNENPGTDSGTEEKKPGVAGKKSGTKTSKTRKRGRPAKPKDDQQDPEEYKLNLRRFENLVPRFAAVGISLEVNADEGTASYRNPKRKKPVVYAIARDFNKAYKTICAIQGRNESAKSLEPASEEPNGNPAEAPQE